MKTTFNIILFCLLFIGNSFTQKVKIRKDIATIDGLEYANMAECNSQTCTIKSMSGENILVMYWESFEKPNPVKRNPKSKSPYHETVTERYSIIKFFGMDIEFESKLLSRKQILKALYKDNVIDNDGKLSVTQAKVFTKKHSRDISSKRPIVIIVK